MVYPLTLVWLCHGKLINPPITCPLFAVPTSVLLCPRHLQCSCWLQPTWHLLRYIMAQPANHLVLTQGRLHDIELDLDHYSQLFDDLHAAAIIPNGNGNDATAEDVRHEEDDNIKLIRSLQDLWTSVICLSTFDGTQDVPDWLEDFTIILSKLVAIPMTTNAMTWSPISLVMPSNGLPCNLSLPRTLMLHYLMPFCNVTNTPTRRSMSMPPSI